jgi:formate dehydrogenase iron-sulfur subunit
MAVESSVGQTFGVARKMVQGVLSPMRKEPPPAPQPAMGFFTDTSLCIGCKACEIACKQWNQLPAKEPVWTGSSYDNTGELSAIAWRHVLFIEQVGRRNGHNGHVGLRSDIVAALPRPETMAPFQPRRLEHLYPFSTPTAG